jgi:hypothetical protein
MGIFVNFVKFKPTPKSLQFFHFFFGKRMRDILRVLIEFNGKEK